MLAYRYVCILASLLQACASVPEQSADILRTGHSFYVSGSALGFSSNINPAKLSAEVKILREQAKNKAAPEGIIRRTGIGEILLGRPQNALPYFRLLVKKAPTNEEYKRLYAESAARAGKLGLAEFLMARMKDKESAEILNLHGLIAYLRREPAEAASWFVKAREADAGHVAASLNLGLLYLEHYRYDEALSEFERVLEKDKNQEEAQLHTAVILRLRKLDGKAQLILEGLAEQHQDHPLVQFNLALLYQASENTSAAEAALDRALRGAKRVQALTGPILKLKEEIKQKPKS